MWKRREIEKKYRYLSAMPHVTSIYCSDLSYFNRKSTVHLCTMMWMTVHIKNFSYTIYIFTCACDTNSEKIYSAMSSALARSRGNLARYRLSANCVHFLRENSTMATITTCFDYIQLHRYDRRLQFVLKCLIFITINLLFLKPSQVDR